MGLRVQTQVSGNVFILHCEGRIVFGDEGAALRERVGSLLSGTPRIAVNLGTSTVAESAFSLGSLSRQEIAVATSSWSLRTSMSPTCSDVQTYTRYSRCTEAMVMRSQPLENR